MVWIVLSILALAAVVVFAAIAYRSRGIPPGLITNLGAARDGAEKRKAEEDILVRKIAHRVAFGIALGITFFWGLGTLLQSIHAVPAGHVGVVYEFGAIRSQTADGLQFIPPWRDLKRANVQVQKQTFENLSSASLETQDVFLTVTINYQVSPSKVQELYRNVGPDYFDRLVVSRLNQIVKDETVQYAAIEITQKRDEITDAVASRLRAELEPYSIAVVTLLIDNIDYTPEFNASIEERQVAAQNAIREQERIKQAEAEAAQLRASSQGRADALVIEATGQSEANRLLDQSLTPQVIQYQAVQRLADNIQIALIPAGEGIILDPAMLLAPR